jgi:signal peptidase I
MRVLGTLFLIIFTAILILFLVVLLPEYRKGTRILSVQSNSMEPAFAPGDAVIMKPTSVDQLNYDDIVSYRSASDPRVIISHRLVDYDRESGLIYTLGDNTGTMDEAVAVSQIVGKVTQVVPRAGYVLDVLYQPIGMIAGVYMPGVLILLFEAKLLYRRLKRPVYQLRSYTRLKQRRA